MTAPFFWLGMARHLADAIAGGGKEEKTVPVGDRAEMKLSKSLQNFWILVVSYGLGCLIALGITLAGYGWRSGLAVLLGLGAVGWLGLAWMKDRLVRSEPREWSARSVVLHHLGWDCERLDRQTRQLEGLGFLHLEDYTLPGKDGVTRSFCHPEHQCFAEIAQWFDPEGQPKLAPIVIFSPLQQGWLLADVGRAIDRRDSWAYLRCPPREVRRYHAAIELEALLETHLRFRRQMMEDLQVAGVTPLSWELYRDLQQELVRQSRRMLRQKSLLLSMGKATWFEWQPKSQWLGDYSPRTSSIINPAQN